MNKNKLPVNLTTKQLRAFFDARLVATGEDERDTLTVIASRDAIKVALGSFCRRYAAIALSSNNEQINEVRFSYSEIIHALVMCQFSLAWYTTQDLRASLLLAIQHAEDVKYSEFKKLLSKVNLLCQESTKPQ
ncbi:hypothetical protein SAMN05421780_104287 [Flexibacter flexilis DSM 6793]|uniref:Uncharacterized protein n=1 Tax=Flexibacter flexilis DSM 6793 TaxID=927664 RepID=A0A1I1IHE7_9BACT|nr:hypothetical protein [Flexibacter flexilis]SFC33193.1 hypothetical protein SAMN05421780_104287 [Flexibacter flexilis DSM 6793]